MHKGPELHVTSDIASPGYIESTASAANRKSKEKLRTESLMPSEILENSESMKKLLDAYYTFMNLDEFIYTEDKTVEDIVLDGKAVFRISDPNNENNTFFTDEHGGASSLILTDQDGVATTIQLGVNNISISNGNELPGSFALSTSEIGKTFQVLGLEAYNTQTARLTTPIKYWMGPGPSHIMNNIEDAMDIDATSQAFLELMQKEIASVLPRYIKVNKRSLYKNIVDYYKIRGSSDSIEIFFRLLFNDFVKVEYPWDKTLIPSSGRWQPNSELPKGGIYLDNKGHLSDTVKIQDSERYQKFSYVVKTGQDLSSWKDVFNKLVHPAGFKFFGEILMIIELTKAVLDEDFLGEGDILYRKVLSAIPLMQPGVIGVEDLPLLVEMFASTFIPESLPNIYKDAQINIPPSLVNDGVIDSVTVVNSGSGYLTPPVLTATDSGIPAVYTAASLTASIANGSISGVTIVSGGKDYNIPSVTAADPAAITFDGSDEEVTGVGIVNISDNTIKLTTTEQEVLSVDSLVTYDSGGSTSIGGLVSGTQYKIAESTGDKVKLKDASTGVEMDITSVGTGTNHSLTGDTATFTATKIDGVIAGVEIVNPGYAYTTPPVITITGDPISGQTISAASVSISLDPDGRLDVDNITITDGGSGYKNAFGSVAANTNHGSLHSIELNPDINHKEYRKAPDIILSDPTAVDVDGNLLTTNLAARAKFYLKSTSIDKINIDNPGSGYTTPPTITISDPDIGINVINNSTFDSDMSGWFHFGDFSWNSDGKVERDAGSTTSNFYYPLIVEPQTIYQVDYDVEHTGGNSSETYVTMSYPTHIEIGSEPYQQGSGHVTRYFLTSGNDTFNSTSLMINGVDDFRGTFDNVSMKKVNILRDTGFVRSTTQSGIINDSDNNTPWSAITSDEFASWSIENNTLLAVPGVGTENIFSIYRQFPFVSGSTYLITCDVTVDGGYVEVYAQSDKSGPMLDRITSSGSYTLTDDVGYGTGVPWTGILFEGTNFDGTISNIKIYQPNIDTRINGHTTESGELATAYARINKQGRVDGIHLINPGSGYRDEPKITITGDGTAAAASGILEPSEIGGINIINIGKGYTANPSIRIGSVAINEYRAKDIQQILIILGNHLSDASRSDPSNDYYNRKGDSYTQGSKKFDFNERIEVFGDVSIENADTTNINKYNVNPFIHT